MGDRWMDERDRRWREREWRRAEGEDRGEREGERWRETRSWSAGADDPAEADYGYGRSDETHHGSNAQAYGRTSSLTSGGAYPRGGGAGGYGRFSHQDYAGRDYGHGAERDRRDYSSDPYEHGRYGAEPGYGRDWESQRDEGWARFEPDRRGDDSRAGRDRYEDERREGGGDFLTRAGERISSWFRGSDLMRGSREDDDGRPRRHREDFGREARPIADPGHRGRGPQGYRRSDERINEEVHDRLTEDPWLDASHIEVKVKSGEVTLSGQVENREAKHRAERLIEDVSGVGHVQNNLRVDPNLGLTGAGRALGSSAPEAEMRRNAEDGGTA